MDWFSWLMVNFFAIGLMRMIVFAAIKSNEIGKTVGKKVEDFGANVFQTLPILPLGQGGERVGIRGVGRGIGGIPDAFVGKFEDRSRKQVSRWLDETI